MATYRSILLRIICDIGFGLLAYTPWIILQFVNPFKRGFFCDDESLKHPFHASTVPSPVMITVSLAVPMITFIVVEFIRYRVSNAREDANRSLVVRSGPRRVEFHPSIIIVYTTTVFFLFGAAATESFTNIGKYSVGRLRPHFFSICMPDYSTFNCTDNRDYQKYVTEYKCLGTDEHRLKEMRLSFPSGHASLTVYAAVFFSMYLQARMTWKGAALMKHFLQIVCLMCAFYTALSRVSDYKHHWSDVLAGGILGIVVAYFMCRYGSEIFKRTGGATCVSHDIFNDARPFDSDGLVSTPMPANSKYSKRNYMACEQNSV